MTFAKGAGSNSKKNQTSSQSGPSRSPNSVTDPQTPEVGDSKMAQTQRQVDEVVTIMRSNVEKVMERDHYLTILDERAEALNAGAAQFERQAVKLKRKYWWKNLKMMVLLGIVIFLVVTGLAFWISSYFDGGSNNDDNPTNSTRTSNSTNNSTVLPAGVYQMVLLSSNSTSI